MPKELDGVILAHQMPNFASWAEAIALERRTGPHYRLKLPHDEAFQLALEELWNALSQREPDESQPLSISTVLALCTRIRDDAVEHRRNLKDFIAAQFNYFDVSVRAQAGVSLVETVATEFIPVDPETAILVIRKVLSEILRNLWSWLSAYQLLPYITAERARRSADQALQSLTQASDLPKLESLLNVLAYADDAEMHRVLRHMQTLTPSHSGTRADARNDDASQASPQIQLRILGKLRDFSGAKRLALDHWEVLSRDEAHFIRVIELPWSASERADLAPRLARLLDEPTMPQAIKNHALLRLIAWDAEPRAVAKTLARGPVSADGLGVVAAVLNTVPIPPAVRSAIPPSMQEGLTVHRREGAHHSILIVPGGAGSFFGIPRELLHRLLSPTGCNLLYLHDESKQFFLAGLPGLGSSHSATVAALQGTLAAMGTEHLHVLGFSGYGFPAIRFALDLGADSVLCYSARTSMKAEFLESDRPARYFGRIMRDIVPCQDHDLREVILRSPNLPRIMLRYGDGYDVDLMHAENLAGLPGVELRPHVGWPGHDSLNASLVRREFDDDLGFLLETRRITDPLVPTP